MPPRMKTLLLIVCSSWIACIASAQNCGAMLRTMSYFRGTIRSVKPLGDTETLNDVDVDSRFAVVIDVDSVRPGITEPKAGETVVFAIHSPSLTFASGKLIGQSFDLQAERMDCGKRFWRFIRLEREVVKPRVEPFEGPLVVGHTYRSATFWDGHDLALSKALDLPMHHGGAVNFVNAETFLEGRQDVKQIDFEVVALHITMIEEGSWASIYDAKIIAAQR